MLQGWSQSQIPARERIINSELGWGTIAQWISHLNTVSRDPGSKPGGGRNLIVSMCIYMFCKKDGNKKRALIWGQPLKIIIIIIIRN